MEKKKSVYIAIPYGGMEESSYSQSLTAVMLAMRDHNVNAFSVIGFGHPLVKMFGVDGTWTKWESVCNHLIESCDELWVLIPNEGHEKVLNSNGVQKEIELANFLNKDVHYCVIENDKLYTNVFFLENLKISRFSSDQTLTS